MFTIVTTASFEKHLRKFIKTHPELKKKIAVVLRMLSSDPFEPKLRLHALQGKLTGLYSVSVTYQYRMTLIFRTTHKEIVLLDIGSHDQVY